MAISPEQLNADPTQWLDVPHDLHESLLNLMERVYPGFEKVLQDRSIHCLKCEGKEPFEVLLKDTFKYATVDGYIGEPDNIEELHTADRK